MIDYINMLRESILEAYTGIIQGLKDGNRIDLFQPYVQSVLEFLQEIASDPNRDEFVVAKAVGVIGDVASSMGLQIKTQLQQPYIAQLLQEGLASGDDTTMDTANWAGGIISQIMQSH
jgi:importin subunit beta-1